MLKILKVAKKLPSRIWKGLDIACIRRSVTVERGGRMVGSGLKRVHGENEGKNEGRFPFPPGTGGNPGTLYDNIEEF